MPLSLRNSLRRSGSQRQQQRRESDISVLSVGSYEEISEAFSLSNHSTTSKSSSSKARRVVKFNNTVKAKKTLRVQDYKLSELEDTWYNQEELDAMREEAYLTYQLFKNQGQEEQADKDEEDDCYRGLEYLARDKTVQIMSYDVVFQEQETKKLLEATKQDLTYKIAQLYGRVSRSSMRDAFKRGMKDEEDAAKYYDSIDSSSESNAFSKVGSSIACETRAKSLLANRKELVRQRVATIIQRTY